MGKKGNDGVVIKAQLGVEKIVFEGKTRAEIKEIAKQMNDEALRKALENKENQNNQNNSDGD